MTTHRVLFTDAPWGEIDLERQLLEPAGYEVVLAPGEDEPTLLPLAADVAAIATCWAPVSARLIETATQCRHIARLGIGLDNIDIPAATARGMIVTNVPDYCVDEVAHHALALLLAHARQVAFFHQQTKQGRYDLQAAAPMRRLSQQTLGLVGFGRIARRLREFARGVGLSVIAHSQSGNDYGTGCRMLPLDELLRRSDYLSIHVPLTGSSQHLIDEAALAELPSDAFVINTSRGGLIDHAALWNALQENRLAGAGLDVFDPEPPDLSQPLFRDERVIVTPHAAFVSREAVTELRQRVARQLLAVLTGQTPEYVVNG